MYNQYISPPREEVDEIHNGLCGPCEPCGPCEQAVEAMSCQPPPQPRQTSALGNLSQALGLRLGSIKFDAETLIALVVVWFLISDGEELDTELLLLIGVLLILGI